MTERLVIIGNGMAPGRMLEHLLEEAPSRYLIGVYGFDIATAGMIGAAYSIPASIFRASAGDLSDRSGARTVLDWTFAVSRVCCAVLSLPATGCW